MITAVMFDIDGTLVDSVDLHAEAWQVALERFGKKVSFAEVRRQIGKGGDQLLPVFLSAREMEKFGDELERYRSKLFKKEYLPRVTLSWGSAIVRESSTRSKTHRVGFVGKGRRA